eukprot:m51a1_g4100 hypothetical protein (380) ;mRNA; r:83519-85831
MTNRACLALIVVGLLAFIVAADSDVRGVNPCSTSPTGQKVNGFLTYFSDNVYACDNWNGKAKKSKGYFVALNGVCGMDNSKYCDRCVAIQGADGVVYQPVRVIDFCDPSNCDYLKKEHLDVLDNNGNKLYKKLDQGKNNKDGLPIIKWWWLSSCNVQSVLATALKAEEAHARSLRALSMCRKVLGYRGVECEGIFAGAEAAQAQSEAAAASLRAHLQSQQQQQESACLWLAALLGSSNYCDAHVLFFKDLVSSFSRLRKARSSGSDAEAAFAEVEDNVFEGKRLRDVILSTLMHPAASVLLAKAQIAVARADRAHARVRSLLQAVLSDLRPVDLFDRIDICHADDVGIATHSVVRSDTLTLAIEREVRVIETPPQPPIN